MKYKNIALWTFITLASTATMFSMEQKSNKENSELLSFETAELLENDPETEKLIKELEAKLEIKPEDRIAEKIALPEATTKILKETMRQALLIKEKKQLRKRQNEEAKLRKEEQKKKEEEQRKQAAEKQQKQKEKEEQRVQNLENIKKQQQTKQQKKQQAKHQAEQIKLTNLLNEENKNRIIKKDDQTKEQQDKTDKEAKKRQKALREIIKEKNKKKRLINDLKSDPKQQEVALIKTVTSLQLMASLQELITSINNSNNQKTEESK